GTEKPETGVMDKPPRSTKDTLLNKPLFIKAFLWYGLLESIICMAAYFFVNRTLVASGLIYRQATTMTLASIVFCQIGMVLNCRTEKQSVFKAGLFSNRRVLFGIVFEVCLLSALIYVPFLQGIFNTAAIGLRDWLFLIILPFPILLLEETRKAITRRIDHKKK
ncbi:MAG TPA: cation-translocating P-type ATPase C-terminal domain-containing protein, partial [Clostridia bacterium]|nr:cation-translocating P-type ATPase C-terminal domain-containing protein [Clostridia bacterium]